MEKIMEKILTPKEMAQKYERVALVLQGGGALGSYQAGVYEGLWEEEIEPDWIAGISIGALNTAIIAGNKPEDRIKALQGFWNTICKTNTGKSTLGVFNGAIDSMTEDMRKMLGGFEAMRAIIEGQNGFFTPRYPLPMPFLNTTTPDEISYYKTTALKNTLLEYTDFDLINKGKIKVSVGAVNIKTGNFVYFDNSQITLRPEHFIASGSLPPGFPAVEIDGEYYWDGGLVSNTPLSEVLNGDERKDTLVFQVDLWSSRGPLPENFLDISERVKDIQYSSKTRMVTDVMEERMKTRKVLQELLKKIPKEMKEDDKWCAIAEKLSEDSIANIIQLIYKDKAYEGHYKDYEFSLATMHEHWSSGLTDIRETLRDPKYLEVPKQEQGFVKHDVHQHK